MEKSYIWISWYHKQDYSSFELHNPWWCSGCRCHDDAETMCAGIPNSTSVEEAKEIVLNAYDERPEDIEWSFAEEKTTDKEWPFSERWPRKDWMVWF